MKKELKLGIIGMSDGNGHPYSWSAIFNGYNEKEMHKCPFKVIPDYLSKQSFPKDSIAGAKVTHIWTQDRGMSESIAKACYIENVVENYNDLIGKVDAVLLARDDAENHYSMSKEIINAGLPIYIDKPISFNLEEVQKIYSCEKYKGQIFTCSALTYSKEFKTSNIQKEKLGNIAYIEAKIGKDWKKYGIHIIEPVLSMFCQDDVIKNIISNKIQDKTMVDVEWESSLITRFTTLGKTASPIEVFISGDKGYQTLIFEDTFYAFKSSLEEFIKSIETKSEVNFKKTIYDSINILEKGDSLG